jgi:hypothetical protein
MTDLITGADILVIAVNVDPVRDVGALLLDCNQQVTRLVVEAYHHQPISLY